MNANLVQKNEKGIVTTNSLLVAKKFEKEHKNVLRDIENLSCSENFRQLNFELSSYTSQQNKELPMYVMTKDGFTFLVMGYTGEKASTFKEDYIEAFNTMEQSLKQLDFSNPDTVLMLAQNWKEERVKRIEAEKKAAIMQPKADFVDRAIDMGHLVDIGQTAKLLKLPFGRNTLFKKLQEKGVFFKGRNEPKQEYVDRGYFDMREKEIPRDNHPAFMVTKVLVTQKGLFWLSKIFESDRKITISTLKLQ